MREVTFDLLMMLTIRIPDDVQEKDLTKWISDARVDTLMGMSKEEILTRLVLVNTEIYRKPPPMGGLRYDPDLHEKFISINESLKPIKED